MVTSKTITTITDFYNTLEKENPTDDEKFFVCNVELDLAKSLIQEFDIETARRLANIIISVTK